MWPFLMEGLPTYGIMLITGIFFAIITFRIMGKSLFTDHETMFDYALIMLLSGLFGARILHVVVKGGIYFQNPLNILRINDGGFTFLGGILGGAVVLIVFRKKIPVMRFADISAVSVAIAHFFGRMGCNFAGCCWGKATSCKLCSLKFTSKSAVEEFYKGTGNINGINQFRLPVQLMEAALVLGIFIFLIIYNTKKRFDGQLLAIYMIIYGGGRFLLEIIRDDPGRGYLFRLNLSGGDMQCCFTSQIIGLIMLVGGIFIIRRKLRKL
ncbi:MAG: prolipoprotein diacylglyceryl transferase [Deltaproteobacteria bacterium]|nr:prolipoprotein diacylglyceryl transferase [Deltaproteobacteria bacterium]